MSQKYYFVVLLSIFLFFHNIISAQGTFNPEWLIKRISPGSNQASQAWGVDVDNNGNIYWTTDQIYPGQTWEIMLYKLDADSNEIWPSPSVYGGIYRQVSYIVKTAGVRTYVGGIADHSFGQPSADMLIFTVDTFSGDTLWSTVWDQGFGYEEVDGIMVGTDGIYVTGWTTGDTTGFDIALLKLNFDGNIMHTNTWGTALDDHQDGHAVMDDSVIYVAGVYGSSNSGYDGMSLLAKFSCDSLSYIDHITFGRNDTWFNQENAQGMASDGTYLYLVGVTTVSPGNVDIFVAKFDKNLNQLWYETWGGSGFESARGITIADNGNIYVGGNTHSFGTGGDVALLSYSPDGTFLGYRIWGGSDEDATQDIVANGNYLYLTGRSKSLHPVNNFAAYLMKVNIDSITTSINYQPVVSDFYLGQNYPNPFNPTTTIEFQIPQSEFITLKIYNILGQHVAALVSEKLTPGKYKYNWDASGFPSGVYFYKLKTAEFTQTKKLILFR
ncbi:T9SS type A sorting domain-containing protein [Calditrichota bacterium]